MTLRERVAALAAAVVIAAVGLCLLDAPVAPQPVRTPITWCYPRESRALSWATDGFTPPEAVRMMVVAYDAVTGERLNATVGLRHPDTPSPQITGGRQVGYWDVPAGFDAIISASTTMHYSANGFRKIPDLPGAALAATVYLMPRAAPLVGTAQRGDRVRVLRPEPAGSAWGFVDRLRASPLATPGVEEAWRQSFVQEIAVRPDGSWSHTCLPGLPVTVEIAPAAGSGKGPVRQTLTPIRDINRASPEEVVAGDAGAAPVALPPYPSGWPAAHISLRVVGANGTPLPATVRVLDAAGERQQAPVDLLGSGEFAVPSRTTLRLEVGAAGMATRRLELRLEPSDRLWIPALRLEPAR